MIKITIDSTNYNIPSEWSDVKLSQYEKWFDADINTKDDEIAFVSKVSNIPLEVLQSLPVSFYNDLVLMISFSSEEGKYEPKNSIVIDGTTYSVASEKELTLAEWVDVDAVLKGDENKLASVLAIVCRPTGETYNSDRLSERIELFKGMTMDKLFPAFSFFLLLNERYQMIMQRYSQVQEMVNQSHLLIEISAKNGVGIKQLPSWQMMILGKWIRLQNWVLSKCSTSYLTKLINKMQKNHKGNLKNKQG